MVRVRAPCGKVAFALYVLFGIVDAFEFCKFFKELYVNFDNKVNVLNDLEGDTRTIDKLVNG